AQARTGAFWVTSAIAVPTISPSMKRSILMFLCECAVGRKKEVANLLRKHGGKTGEELKAEGK
ncbi:MAG: hypothetical protein QGG00_09850, partial [Verrucomicrobiota bacterium]|nr:hypothetical protein [Verrucomicrobiota bacterium]